MAQFTYDHMHLRSPDPEATAALYEPMFAAEVIRTTQQGKPCIELKLGGANVLIAAVDAAAKVNPPPQAPYRGLEHFGLRVADIDASSPSSRPRVPSSRWSRRTFARGCASPSCADERACRSSSSSASAPEPAGALPPPPCLHAHCRP
jgi:hypothetical protein